MNLTEANTKQFDVVMLPPGATELIELTRALHVADNRERHEFMHEMVLGKHKFVIHCLAVSRRPGVIAPEMKKRKEQQKCSD